MLLGPGFVSTSPDESAVSVLISVPSSPRKRATLLTQFVTFESFFDVLLRSQNSFNDFDFLLFDSSVRWYWTGICFHVTRLGTIFDVNLILIFVGCFIYRLLLTF